MLSPAETAQYIIVQICGNSCFLSWLYYCTLHMLNLQCVNATKST